MQPQSPPQRPNKGAPTKQRPRQGAATGPQPTQLQPLPQQLPPPQQQPGAGVVRSAAAAVVAPPAPSKTASPPQRQQPPDPEPEEPQDPVTEVTLQDVHALCRSLLQEYAYWVDESWVSGQIPKELCGTYYRNGPGLQVGGGRYKRHLFDGDGMLLSLAFSGGRAFFRNKYVRTQGFVAEQAAGRPLYRNSFSNGAADGGLWFNPFDFKFKNVANTGVLSWAGKLLALWEGGLPHEVHPWSLDTLGESRLGGALQGSTLSAHYRVVHEPPRGRQQHAVDDDRAASGGGGGGVGEASERRLIMFSADLKFGGSAVTFSEFDEAGERLHTTTHALEGVAMGILHDAAVTEHYYVLLVGPTAFDTGRFFGQYVWGGCSIAQCLRHDTTQPSRVLLIPRPGRPSGLALKPQCLEAPPSFSFHHINAFEVPQAAGQAEAEAEPAAGQPRRPGAIVLDTIMWREMDFSVKQPPASLEDYNGGSRAEYHRLVLDLATGTTRQQHLLRRTVEFPATDPRVASRPHRHAWLCTDIVNDAVRWGPHQAVVRVTVPPTLGVSDAPCAGVGLPVPPAAAAAGVRTDLWCPGPRCYCGEPMFIPRPDSREEGDGWLLLVVHNAERSTSSVVILEAMALARGPVATIHLPHHLPVGLHGCWEGEYRGPDPANRAYPPWQVTGTIRDYQ